jgi:hypothetical protein
VKTMLHDTIIDITEFSEEDIAKMQKVLDEVLRLRFGEPE